MPKDTIKSIIDFFYPPFRKIMPLQTFRYAACGGANALLGFIVFVVMYQFVFKEQVLHLGFYSFEAYTVALVLSSTTVFVVGFLLNKYVVFTESNLRGRVQFFRYFLSLTFNLSLNYILLKAFVEFLNIHAIIAQVITTAIIITVSYFSQRYFTFKTKVEVE